jgi:hypothetical protein
MVYDSDYRENSITAVGTRTALTAQGADTPGAFVVPTNVSRITEIRISVAPAVADDANLGWTSMAWFYGSGIVLSEGKFPGPVGLIEGAATMSGNIQVEQQVYLTNIPVRPGGTFSVDGVMNGEDIGALHMLVEVIYDGPVVGKIRDMDCRFQDLTAANTLVTLNEILDAVAVGDMQPAYGMIGEIYLGMGAKITGGTVAAGLAVHLSGPGLLSAGNYKFIGPGWGIRSDAVAGAGKMLTKYMTNIATKMGNAIRVQAQMIEGDLGTTFAVVGFAYY